MIYKIPAYILSYLVFTTSWDGRESSATLKMRKIMTKAVWDSLYMVSELVREFCQEPELVQHFKKIMSKGSEQTFKICKWSKHVNRCSTSLVIREMQIRTTRTWHLIPTGMNSRVKNSDNSKCWRGRGETESPYATGGSIKRCSHLVVLSHVQLFVTPWTVALQAPLSVKFARREYRSGFPWCSHLGIQPSSSSND